MLSPNRYRAILIEDDDVFANELTGYLSSFGFEIRIRNSLQDLQDCLSDAEPDVLILDQFVKGYDALSFLPSVRETYQGCVVIITGNTNRTDRVIGLELGADAYIPKSDAPREVLAQLRAALRRSPAARRAGAASYAGAVEASRTSAEALDIGGNWYINVQRRLVTKATGEAVVLPGMEFDIFAFLCKRRGTTVSREELARSAVPGLEPGHLGRRLDSCISRIRRTLRRHGLEQNVLRSIRGRGYVFTGLF